MKKIVTSFLLILSLQAFSQPLNDEPCGATTIAVVQGACTPTTVYNYLGATASTTLPNPSCTWNATKKDVWYKFTIPVDGTVTINTDLGGTGTDFTFAIYSAPACNGIFTYIGCDDDSGPGNMPQLSLTSISPGITYYIRLWAFNAAEAAGQIKICLSFLETTTGGKVGIGTVLPTSTLDVNGDITIRGGSPADGKVLVSDNLGKAAWEKLPTTIGSKRKISVPFAAFRPENPGADLRISLISGGWIYFDNGIAPGNKMFAPLLLPDSVRITKMTLYYLDASAAVNIEAGIDIVGYNPPGISYGSVIGGTITTSGAADVSMVLSQSLTTGALNSVVKNTNQTYLIKIRNISGVAWPGIDVKIGMVEVEYEIL